MNRVKGKVALVTGGAAGLGEAMAKMLFRHHDVTDERAWPEAIAATVERFGRLDVLVNNAGVGRGGGPEEQTLERWRADEHQPRRRVPGHEARDRRDEEKPALRRLDHQPLLDRGHHRRPEPRCLQRYLREQGDVQAGRKALDALHPIGRVGEPDDIAYGAVYLASDESKFVTGAELVIDGGYTAQ
jgi:NAD(P)-dependent dehydrogenase (short-subunit alcohol dehydrogenase family)